MGYNLRIGEAIIDYSEDVVRVNAVGVTLEESPADGSPTDHTNDCWPSYSGWADFCEAMDLKDVMFCTRNGGAGSFEIDGREYLPLLVDHPGARPVTAGHLKYIEQKVAAYRAKHPDHIAQHRPPKPGAKPIFGDEYREDDLVDDPKYDSNLCRAEWLLFWLRWAIANCKQPVFFNS